MEAKLHGMETIEKQRNACKKEHEQSCTLTWTPFTPASSSAITLNIKADLSSSADHPTGVVSSRPLHTKPVSSGYIPLCPVVRRSVSAPQPSFCPHALRSIEPSRSRSW